MPRLLFQAEVGGSPRLKLLQVIHTKKCVKTSSHVCVRKKGGGCYFKLRSGDLWLQLLQVIHTEKCVRTSSHVCVRKKKSVIWEPGWGPLGPEEPSE